MNARKIVHDILRDYPESRNSDEKLLLIYESLYWTDWWNVRGFITEHYEFIRNHARYRALWQNTKWLFLATEIVKSKRESHRKEVCKKMREEKQGFACNIYNYAKRIIRNK